MNQQELVRLIDQRIQQHDSRKRALRRELLVKAGRLLRGLGNLFDKMVDCEVPDDRQKSLDS